MPLAVQECYVDMQGFEPLIDVYNLKWGMRGKGGATETKASQKRTVQERGKQRRAQREAGREQPAG